MSFVPQDSGPTFWVASLHEVQDTAASTVAWTSLAWLFSLLPRNLPVASYTSEANSLLALYSHLFSACRPNDPGCKQLPRWQACTITERSKLNPERMRGALFLSTLMSLCPNTLVTLGPTMYCLAKTRKHYVWASLSGAPCMPRIWIFSPGSDNQLKKPPRRLMASHFIQGEKTEFKKRGTYLVKKSYRAP